MVFRFWRPIVSGWRRRPKSLACASFNPSRHTSKKGRSIWLWHPWGHDVQKWGYAAPGHLRQYAAALTMQWSVDRPGAPDVCLSKDQPHGWVETVGAGGRKSQKAPAIWLGGVSAVISASDLDAPSFGVEACNSNEHEGALPDSVRLPESASGVPGSGMEQSHHQLVRAAAALVVPFMLTSCTGGEALKSFSFTAEAMGPQVATIDLPRDGTLSFWNSLDLGYEEGTSVAFKLSIQRPGDPQPTEVICDALTPSMTLMSSMVQVQNRINQSWKLARMRCGYGPVPEAQQVQVSAVPVVSRPVEIRRLDLELKR